MRKKIKILLVLAMVFLVGLALAPTILATDGTLESSDVSREMYTVTVIGGGGAIAILHEDGSWSTADSKEFAPGDIVHITIHSGPTTIRRGPFAYFRKLTSPSVDFIIGAKGFDAFVMPTSDVEVDIGYGSTVTVENGIINRYLVGYRIQGRDATRIEANEPEEGYRFVRWESVSGDASLKVVDPTSPDTLLAGNWGAVGVIRAVFAPITELDNGWVWLRNGWYFYQEGVRQTGWVHVNNQWYFLNPHVSENGHIWSRSVGSMRTGWVLDRGNWYFLNPARGSDGHRAGLPHGAMQTGWVLERGSWYFLNPARGLDGHRTGLPHGAMQTGWVRTGGSWFFMNNSGRMQTGWVHTGGSWFFMNNSGRMQTGWVHTDGSWFFMNNSGRMQTGWVQTGGSWFFMNNSGRMQTGRVVINGVPHLFNASGRWQGRTR